MKTKVLKTVMPILAFVMAIGLAFATETTDNSRTGYYKDPDTGQVEEVNVDCELEGGEICEFEGNQVFANPGRTIELYKPIHP